MEGTQEQRSMRTGMLQQSCSLSEPIPGRQPPLRKDTGAAVLSPTGRCGASWKVGAVHWDTFTLPKSMEAWTEVEKGNEVELDGIEKADGLT